MPGIDLDMKSFVSTEKATAKPGTFFDTLEREKIQDKTLIRFANAQLERINLAGAIQITDAGVEALAGSSPNLQYINLSAVNQVTDRGVQSLAERCKNLRCLLLAGCTISDHTLAVLSFHSHSLREIDLSCCRPSSDTKAPNCIVMEGCSDSCRITDGGLMKLSEGCPLLESASFAFCRTITGIGLAYFVKHCPGLVSINLAECSVISDDGFLAIAETCKNLKVIELPKCYGLSNLAVQQLFRLPLLVSINIGGCREITDQAFAGFHCPTIERLNLNNIGRLTDAVLIAIAEGCPPGLKELELCGSQITDIGIVRLVSQVSKVVKLNLRGCKNISDAGLGFLSDRCSALQYIDLSRCTRRVTEEGILSLSEGCPMLKFVAISGMNWITDEFIEMMEEERGVQVYDDGALYDEDEEDCDENDDPV